MKFIDVSTNEQIQKTATLASEIWQECYADILTPQQIHYMLANLQSETAIQNQIETQGYHYYLLQEGDQDLGYLALQPEEGKLYLSKFYLLPAYRGQGYAPKVMAFVLQQAARFGCRAFWLTVNKQNTRAMAAYQKAGMVLVRQQVADIGGGFVMDDFVFEKAL